MNTLLPGTLEMLILRTLTRKSLHGYGIVQSIQQVSEDLLKIEEGSLYPALQRLLRDGSVAAEWGMSERKRRVRTYRITPAGRKQLQREVNSFEKALLGISRVLRPVEL
jgi:PadR family transcriptional regulator PadR